MRLAATFRRWALLAGVVAALAPTWAGAQQFTFQEYREKDGLTNLSVPCMMQDRSGFLWMCTENGLFRFDGNKFTRLGENEGIDDTDVHGVVEDPAGRIWVATVSGVYVGDGKTFHAVEPNGRSLNPGYGKQMAVLAPDDMLVIDRGRLKRLRRGPQTDGWNATDFFTAAQTRNAPELEHLSSVAVDARGRILLGCGQALCTVERDGLKTWDVDDGVPADTWLSWLIDGDGALWVRGLAHVVVMEAGALRFQQRDPPHAGLTAQLDYVPLAMDRAGSVLTRTDSGLARWQHGRWQEFGAGNGLPRVSVTSLLVDRDGDLWLGTPGRGVARWLGYGHFESWTAAQGLGDDMVWTVLRTQNHGLITGGRAGCHRLDAADARGRSCDIRGLPSGEILSMAERADHSLWIAMTSGRLLRVADGSHVAVPVTSPSLPIVRHLYGDSNNAVWMCTRSGVFVADPGSNRVFRLASAGVGSGCSDVAESRRGVVWLAGPAGLTRVSSGRIMDFKVDDEHARAGFASVTAAEGGWLWAAGSSHGLMHLHVVGDRVDAADWVNDPLVARASVLFTRLDRRGWLWVGTDAGIDVFDGRLWRRFSQRDGLIWNDVNQNSFWADDDGTVWIGTSGGLSHIIRPEDLMQSTPIDLRVTAAEWGDDTLGRPKSSAVHWRRDAALNLHLASLDYGAGGETVVSVRLRGLSDAWFQTHDQDLHFPGLEPGHYRFEAMAADTAHQRSSKVVSVDFEVLPPWWRTRWFEILVAALVVALIARLMQWRLRKLQLHRRKLERRLREHQTLLVRATRDSLTGLWNRTAILELLDRAIEASRKESKPLAIALIDVDHFKHINDTYGHLAGDFVLHSIATRLGGKVRASDALGRYGGEELLLVMPDLPVQHPSVPVERMREAINEMPFKYQASTIAVAASVGVAWLDLDADVAESLLNRADAALYAAKDGGRNRVCYSAMERTSRMPRGGISPERQLAPAR